MKTNSQLGGVLGTAGLVAGAFYSFKKGNKIGVTALYAIGFGVAGILIGNSITKFYE